MRDQKSGKMGENECENGAWDMKWYEGAFAVCSRSNRHFYRIKFLSFAWEIISQYRKFKDHLLYPIAFKVQHFLFIQFLD